MQCGRLANVAGESAQRPHAAHAVQQLWPSRKHGKQGNSLHTMSLHSYPTMRGGALETVPLEPLEYQHVAELRAEELLSDSVDQNIALSLAEYIAECSQAFDIDDHIEVQPGRRGLPTVYMSHPSGYSTEINLWGATVTSLLRPDGQDVLCLTPGNTFDGIHPIRGGIQIVFPQYGRPDGIAAVTGASWPSLPSNGFLNHLHWSICSSSAQPGSDPQPSVSLEAESDDSTLELWPHHFSAIYTVQLSYAESLGPHQSLLSMPAPVQLRCSLSIRNEGKDPMTFAACLQPHYAVPVMLSAELDDLPWGSMMLNADHYEEPVSIDDVREHDLVLGVERLDRVYLDVSRVSFCPGNSKYKMELANRLGFKDMGVWHECQPEARLQQQYVALPQGALGKPVRLSGGECWMGEMVLTMHELTWMDDV